MTSFTKRLGTSFTLPRSLRSRGSVKDVPRRFVKDVMRGNTKSRKERGTRVNRWDSRRSVGVVVGYRPHQHGEYRKEDQCDPPMHNSKRDGKENNKQPDPPREPLLLCRLLTHPAPSDSRV